MVDASLGPPAKKARPSSVDDVILSQDSRSAPIAGGSTKGRPGHKGAMMTLAEVGKSMKADR